MGGFSSKPETAESSTAAKVPKRKFDDSKEDEPDVKIQKTSEVQDDDDDDVEDEGEEVQEDEEEEGEEEDGEEEEKEEAEEEGKEEEEEEEEVSDEEEEGDDVEKEVEKKKNEEEEKEEEVGEEGEKKEPLVEEISEATAQKLKDTVQESFDSNDGDIDIPNDPTSTDDVPEEVEKIGNGDVNGNANGGEKVNGDA